MLMPCHQSAAWFLCCHLDKKMANRTEKNKKGAKEEKWSRKTCEKRIEMQQMSKERKISQALFIDIVLCQLWRLMHRL